MRDGHTGVASCGKSWDTAEIGAGNELSTGGLRSSELDAALETRNENGSRVSREKEIADRDIDRDRDRDSERDREREREKERDRGVGRGREVTGVTKAGDYRRKEEKERDAKEEKEKKEEAARRARN